MEQPIFYPVLDFGYAEQIACDWNTKSHSVTNYLRGTRLRMITPPASSITL